MVLKPTHRSAWLRPRTGALQGPRKTLRSLRANWAVTAQRHHDAKSEETLKAQANTYRAKRWAGFKRAFLILVTLCLCGSNQTIQITLQQNRRRRLIRFFLAL